LPGREEEVAMTTATEAGYVEMRIAKAVGFAATEDELFQYVVLRRWQATGTLPSRSAGPRPSAWRLTSMGSIGLVR
jgi:hypothetical protein